MFELFLGAMEFSQSVYVGELGAKIKEEYEATMGNDANMWACFLYDATYAPALTINWMLDIGMEYED